MSTALKNSATTTNTLTPTDNYTLSVKDNPDNPFRIEDQGRYAGDSNYGTFSIFLRFVLPSQTPGSEITQASLVLHAESDSQSSYPLSVYVIGNAWQINAISMENRPLPSGTPALSFTVDSGDDTSLDLTDAVNAAYHTDGVITLLIANAEYNYNAQDFSATKSLRITVSAP